MRNKREWGGVGMNQINPVTMDFHGSTLQGGSTQTAESHPG